VSDEADQHEAIEGVEVVDGLPVVVVDPPADLEAARPVPVPARQAAALAATGFVAGAATAAVVTRRRLKPGRRRKRKKGTIGEIVTSNSFLVDVHLLKRD
jgi:hypothetical protein